MGMDPHGFLRGTGSRHAARRAAVVGAGLAGLTAAFRLQQAGWQVTVLEAASQPGGRVQTIRRDGYQIDTGASAIAESYHAYVGLAHELGLGAEIHPVSPCVGIFRQGRLHELNLKRPLSLASTGVLSIGAKLRMVRLIWDIAVARKRGQLDYSDMSRAAPLDTESADRYARRVLGDELADYFASPIVRVMLIANADQISKVELLSGVANIMTTRISALKGGQGRLPEVLSQRVKPKFDHPVSQVREAGMGVAVQFRNAAGIEQEESFDACVVACPLPQAVAMCPGQRDVLGPLNAKLQYTQSMTVALAFRRPPRAKAFLVQMPTCEDREIALLFLDHNKAADRAPPDQGLLDCHWEAEAAKEWSSRPDADIVERTLQTVHRIFPELRDGLIFSHVTRWPQALPRTAVGTYRSIGAFNASLNPTSPIQFASDYMSEAGQNSAIELGQRAASALIGSRSGVVGPSVPRYKSDPNVE